MVDGPSRSALASPSPDRFGEECWEKKEGSRSSRQLRSVPRTPEYVYMSICFSFLGFAGGNLSLVLQGAILVLLML